MGVISNLINDLKEKFTDPAINNTLLINSLSKSVAEANKLACHVESELNSMLHNEIFDNKNRGGILKEWDVSKNDFNLWVDKWRTLFKEINKTKNLNCIEFFRSLEMVG